MFTSTMSAPIPSTICAAAAILPGSPPKIWIETGRSSSVYSAYSSVRSMPRTSPSELTISLTTRPQPPWRLTSRRKAVSVIPAIGATPRAGSTGRAPIFIGSSGRDGSIRAGGRDLRLGEEDLVGLLQVVVLPLDDGLIAQLLQVLGQLRPALLLEDAVGDQVPDGLELRHDGLAAALEFDDLVAALRADRLRGLPDLHALHRRQQLRRHLVRVDRPDQAAVGLR